VARPGGLGRGLGALIPTGISEPVAGLAELSISSIRPNPQQPREHFDEEALAALAESIREVGVLQPVLVREADDGYELIAGERRWRAARRVGLQTVPAIVRVADDAAMLQQAIVENVQREQLNPLEEAAAYQQLIEDFAFTHDEVATRVGKSRTTITNTLRLLQLPPTIQRYLKEGTLRMGHARALLGTPDRAFQEQLARRASTEDLSVREVEEAIRRREESAATRVAAAGPATNKMRPPGLLELEELQGDYLETRVKITMGPRHGRVQIDFANLEDLERIYRAMTPMPTLSTAAAPTLPS
jgi:ParB family transcriptional regulator, chromosome partitioning protein